jgi:hypothetical protein
MADGIEVLKVGLDNVQKLLEKIDDNQTRLFDTQSQHSKELERLNGLIEKNGDTTQLQLETISKELKSQGEKTTEAVNKLDSKLVVLESKHDADIKEVEQKHEKDIEKLEEKIDSEIEKLEDKIEPNVKFRQNMEGFSWVRHGVPFLMSIVGIVSLIFALWKG